MRRGRTYNESKRKRLTDERGKRETERSMHTERESHEERNKKKQMRGGRERQKEIDDKRKNI